MNSSLKLLTLAFVYFVFLNLFEAAQQYYYINNFNLAGAEEVSFLVLLKNHGMRWLVWAVFALPFGVVVLKNPITQQNLGSLVLIIKYSLFVGSTLLITLVSISILQLWTGGDNFSAFTEYFLFYVFQKSALFVNAYLGLIVIIHLYRNYQILDLKIIELSDLKEQYQKLYQSFKEKTYQDATPLIQIKIGNKIKAIPLSEITWIQSDDYCVKIHTKDQKAYNLRKSMKAMEQELATKGFVRIHRNSIVNREAIESFSFSNEPKVGLKNGMILTIASSRIPKVRAMLKEVV